MATQVQFRGGNTSDHSNFNGVAREVTVDTDKKTVVVHDGIKDGGYPAMSSIGSTTIKSQDTDASKTRETRYFLEAIPAQGAQMSLYDANEAQQVRISADDSADTFFLNTKVGIGTSSPAHELHVSSSTTPTFRLSGNTNTFEIKADSSTTAIRNTTGTNLEFGTGNTGRFNIDTAGTFNQVDGKFSVTANGLTSMSDDLRVGGTAAYDGVPLEVEVQGSTSGAVGITLINTKDSDASATCVVRSMHDGRRGGDIVFGRENASDWNPVANADGFISLNPAENGAAVERMRITSAGSVLIGPAGAPATTITGAGAATFAGTTQVGTIGINTATNGGFEVTANGRLTVQVPNTLATNDLQWRGYYGTDLTSAIYANGDATFNSTLQGGTTSHTGKAVQAYNNSTSNSTIISQNEAAGPVWQGWGSGGNTSSITAAGAATFAGLMKSGSAQVLVASAGTNNLYGGNSYFGDVGDDSNDANAYITNTGAGWFGANTTIGGYDSTNSATKGIQLQTGGCVLSQSDTAADSLWLGFLSGDQKSKITADGQLTLASTVTCSTLTETSSDQRFKKNITDANPQLADVTALGGKLRNWDWNDEAPISEKDIRFLGLVAQEVESICPGIIHTVPRTKDGAELTPESTDADGNVTPATYEQVDDSYKTIKTSVLVFKLLGAVAELSEKVAALEAA